MQPQTFPVVCIGMSAGGISPLKMIFKKLPANTGLAFVVIHHVRNVPTRLPQLLSAWTEMPVALAVTGESVRRNSVYVLPSGMEIILSDGSFAMRPQTKRHGFSNVLTIFLDSLSKRRPSGCGCHSVRSRCRRSRSPQGISATWWNHHSSGTSNCGESRNAISAIQTGVVDDVLPPEAIAGKLEQVAQQFRGSAA